mgnify:CR=1 FL=1
MKIKSKRKERNKKKAVKAWVASQEALFLGPELDLGVLTWLYVLVPPPSIRNKQEFFSYGNMNPIFMNE